MAHVKVRSARFDELDTTMLYALLRLRSEVFVAEQGCAYNDLDGRDLEAETVHVWATGESGAPVAYLRVLYEPNGGAKITRVVTAARSRGQGLAGRLLDAALVAIGDRPARLDAQSYAADLYRKYGFEVDGPEFIEDGIPHVPMSRPGSGRSLRDPAATGDQATAPLLEKSSWKSG